MIDLILCNTGFIYSFSSVFVSVSFDLSEIYLTATHVEVGEGHLTSVLAFIIASFREARFVIRGSLLDLAIVLRLLNDRLQACVWIE